MSRYCVESLLFGTCIRLRSVHTVCNYIGLCFEMYLLNNSPYGLESVCTHNTHYARWLNLEKIYSVGRWNPQTKLEDFSHIFILHNNNYYYY